MLMKVETHNHPTAISPFPGAATGAGGEIRDEGAVGRGGKPKAGLCGFSVSHLRVPDEACEPWEAENPGKPDRIVNAWQIMVEGPLGAAAFNNEFGRPNLGGYFRTMELQFGGEWRGYHKPIMIAGGLGNIAENHVDKRAGGPRGARHAHRPGRWCRELHGLGTEPRGSRLRERSARQRRGGASVSGGAGPLPGR
jgi:phosphoribosylformylglycinamidine synthase